MTLSEAGYKHFKVFMTNMDFSNEDLFLRNCVLATVNPDLAASERVTTKREIQLLKQAGKK